MVQVLRLTPTVCLILLAACATPDEGYPSLAIRDTERVSGSMEVEPAPPLPEPSAATIASVDEIAATARAAHARFLAAEPEARSVAAAAAGSGRGSEAWSRAQVAIADLESIRSQAMIALADLDRIYVDAATSAQATQRISATRSEVDALVAQENAAIQALLARVSG